MKIATSYFRVPGPAPECDWSARFDDMDGGGPVGYGLTEQEAILDLTMNYDEPSVLRGNSIATAMASELVVVLAIFISAATYVNLGAIGAAVQNWGAW